MGTHLITAAVAASAFAISNMSDAAPAQKLAPPPCATIRSPDWVTSPGNIFFVSSRAPSCVKGSLSLSNNRARQLEFGEANGHGASVKFAEASSDEWQRAFAEAVKAAPSHRALIFVHGYYNTATEAIDTAQAIRAATRFEGPIIAFIWPSQHEHILYDKDQTNAEWTTTYFRWLLNILLRLPSSTTIISHSMGNRITWPAISELALSDPGLTKKIAHFVMASADVDRDMLSRDIQTDLATLPDVTIYASSDDRALDASYRFFHGYRRAGDLGPRHGTDTPPAFSIDAPNATLVDTNNIRHSTTGHDDFIASPEGAADLCRLVNGADTSIGRKGPVLPRTWQLLSKTTASDACTQQSTKKRAQVRSRSSLRFRSPRLRLAALRRR